MWEFAQPRLDPGHRVVRIRDDLGDPIDGVEKKTIRSNG